MNRREFVSAGAACLVTGASAGACTPAGTATGQAGGYRSLFPRVGQQTFLNGAGGTPLGVVAEDGIRRYLDFARLGPADGRGDYFNEVVSGVRARFAALIGANESEIGLVECTKAGEQIALDALDTLRRDGNVVTNDLHFSGSLHNYEGLRRAGVDVRVVRADERFDITLDRMADAIDDRTALVAVSLVSNVNGRIEPVAESSRMAHDHGAFLFADIIQAAGAIPIDVHAMGIDVAATSSYKWLFGIHGAGFLYVRDELQGSALPDHLFPGHVRRNYAPWTAQPDASAGDYTFVAPTSAVRYKPGHVSYLGYAEVYEGLGFIERAGGPTAIQRHSTQFVARLLDAIDTDTYRVLTPEPDRAPILSLEAPSMDGMIDRLAAANVVIGAGGDMERLLRISPAIYNDEADIDRLAEVLRG